MFHFTKAILRVGGPILGSYFSWIRKFNKNPDKYPFEYRYNKLRKLLVKLSKALSIEYHVEGLENLPDEASCYVSNHLSAADPVAFISNFDKPCTFVAKKELENKPFAGKTIHGIDGLFLDRKDLKQSLRLMMKVEDDLTNKKDKSWIIFPEGTRNKDQMHNLGQFHHGTFRPAFKAKVPIVPIAIYGSFRTLKLKPQYKRYPVFIKVLKPLYPKDYENMTTNQIAEYVQNEIERTVSFELRELDHKWMQRYKGKYRFNQIL